MCDGFIISAVIYGTQQRVVHANQGSRGISCKTWLRLPQEGTPFPHPNEDIAIMGLLALSALDATTTEYQPSLHGKDGGDRFVQTLTHFCSAFGHPPRGKAIGLAAGGSEYNDLTNLTSSAKNIVVSNCDV